MADNTLNISPPLKFEIKTPPRGMIDYDPAAIHPDQQEQLNEYKLNLMKDNITYVTRHPEVRAILAWAGEYLGTVRPRNVLNKISSRFSLPDQKLRNEVNRILKEQTFSIEDELAESEDEDWDY